MNTSKAPPHRDLRATTLHAQPYDISATGFYFESYEEYQSKAAAARNDHGEPVEEFEIQFIDGETIDAQLFAAWGIHQGDSAAFLKAVEDWDGDQKTKAINALDEGISEFNPATDNPDDLEIDLYFVDTMEALAREFVEEGLFGDIPDHLSNYIDYEAIARDLAFDYSETTIGGEPVIYRAA